MVRDMTGSSSQNLEYKMELLQILMVFFFFLSLPKSSLFKQGKTLNFDY